MAQAVAPARLQVIPGDEQEIVAQTDAGPTGIRHDEPMLPSRRRTGALQVADNALLVVGAVVVGLLVLKLLGWLVGTVFLLVKVALVAFVIAAAVRFALSARK